MKEFEKVYLSDLSVKQEALDFLEKNFDKLYDDSFSEKIENYLVDLLNNSDDWLSLNAAISIFTIILSSKNELKSYFKNLVKLFIEKYESLALHHEYRLRVNIQKLSKLLIIHDKEKSTFKKFIEILLNDLLNNLKISNSLGIFSHLETPSTTDNSCNKMLSSPKSDKKDCCPDYLINSPRNTGVNKQSEPLSILVL